MPICTYLNDREGTLDTSDEHLNELLADVRKFTGEDWRIRETTYESRRWFWRTTVKRGYTLYHHVNGPEFQIINFYQPDERDREFATINTQNPAAIVAAYLYGVLAGLQTISPIQDESK